MKKISIYLFAALFFYSCSEQNKETPAVNIDSIATVDSAVQTPVVIQPPKVLSIHDFIGKWKITMETTETTCEGNKEGDIKQEVWTITKADGKIVVVVTENTNTNDTYTGDFSEQKFKLKGSAYGLFVKGDVSVKGELIDENNFEGVREIIIDQPCKIVYKLTGIKKD